MPLANPPTPGHYLAGLLVLVVTVLGPLALSIARLRARPPALRPRRSGVGAAGGAGLS
jgi:hypothetical protein